MTRIMKIAAPLAVLIAVGARVRRDALDGPDRQLEEGHDDQPGRLLDAEGRLRRADQGVRADAAGKDVSFSQSYGASGDQARAVAAGQPADVVALSLAPDVGTLVKAGVVSGKWNKNKWNGMVARSVVSLLVRKGNPKHIRGWGDLTRQGIQVLTPNPFTSGGARWNVMAAYGAKRRTGATPTSRRSST